MSLPRRGMHFSCAFGGMQMKDKRKKTDDKGEGY